MDLIFTAATPLAQAETPGVITYFLQANLAGKVIVLLLAAFSLLAWTVMVGKALELQRFRSLNRIVQRELSRHAAVLGIESEIGSLRGPFARLLQAALVAYRRYGQGNHTARIGHVENALQRAVNEATARYEDKMVVLGSIVTGAPFLGLLGTVWGVMDAFGGIATEGTAGIGQLAPGVSGALLTTVAGLLVAIPSVFGYNYLLTRAKVMVVELENFASVLADRIELEDRDTASGFPASYDEEDS